MAFWREVIKYINSTVHKLHVVRINLLNVLKTDIELGLVLGLSWVLFEFSFPPHIICIYSNKHRGGGKRLLLWPRWANQETPGGGKSVGVNV